MFGVWSAVNWPAVSPLAAAASSASVVSFVAIQVLVQFSIDYCLLTHSSNSLRIATFDCLFSPLPKSEVLVQELAFWDSVCLLGFSIFLFSSLKAANSFCQLLAASAAKFAYASSFFPIFSVLLFSLAEDKLGLDFGEPFSSYLLGFYNRSMKGKEREA